MQLDQKQEAILETLGQIAKDLQPVSLISHFHKFFQKKHIPHGIYLYGTVGTGKTMLMKRFFDLLKVQGNILHYQDFMMSLHKKLHLMQESSKDKVILDIVDSIAAEFRVLCIDELEIKDITDAMLVMRLFKCLLKKKVFLFITTNIKPDNLYQDGIQRESFLPFIAMVKKDFLVLNLESDIDYRFFRSAAIDTRVFYPANLQNKEQLELIKSQLCSKSERVPGQIEVFGRKIFFTSTHQNILFTNFQEMCAQNLSYADYVNICQYYKIIVLEDVPEIKEDETDLIIRFINLIDNIYFYKVLLFISLDKKPEEIYKSGKRRSEFKRTISRLNEINTQNYLT